MNGSKHNTGNGGARGASNGLRGGKTKRVVRTQNDRGIESQEPDSNKGTHDAPTVWRHGRYVMIRPPRGPGIALRRAGASSHSRVYGGDPMTNFSMSKDIIDNGDNHYIEDFDDGDNGNDGGGDDGEGCGGDDNGGDGDVDGRELIKRQGKKNIARSLAGGQNRGRGSFRGNGRGNGHGAADNVGEVMVHSSAGSGRGRGGGRSSEQVNSHGGTNNNARLTTDAYHPLHEPSDDDEDEPIPTIGRGPVVPPPIPTLENRIWIWVENDEFNIQNPVSRIIGCILKLMWSGGWQGWKDVPILHRERMFERFQKYYQWEDEEKYSVYSCWERCIKGKFPNLLSKARKFAKTLALRNGIEVGNDWTVTIPFKPQWISQDSWKQLIDVWNTSSWQDKSSQNSKNREKATGGRHTAGSKSFVTVRKEVDNAFKTRAKFGIFWLQTHAKKGSRPLDRLPVSSESADFDLGEFDDVEEEKNADWVDTRAGEAYESYMELVIKKYGDDVSLHPEFDMDIWCSIARGKKKRRLYGTSNISDPYFVLTGAPSKPSTSGSFPPGRSDKVLQLEEKIVELEREKIAELEREKVEKQAMLEKIEEHAKMYAEMNETLQLLSRNHLQYFPPS